MELRVRALETLLTRKGYVDAPALDRIIETDETRGGPHNGAAVVAREFKRKNADIDAASGRFAEAISQIKVVKSFVQERRELTHLTERFSDTVDVTLVK